MTCRSRVRANFGLECAGDESGFTRVASCCLSLPRPPACRHPAGACRDVADRGHRSLIRAYDGGPYQTCRGELQEMAKVAADRRDEGLWPADPGAGRDRSPRCRSAAAERSFGARRAIRANAARLRERDIDPATCEQIDAVVATILSAAALRDPADPRVRQLADVLGHLERRIQAMLGRCGACCASAPRRLAGQAGDVQGRSACRPDGAVGRRANRAVLVSARGRGRIVDSRHQAVEQFRIDIAAGQHRDGDLALHVDLAGQQRRQRRRRRRARPRA